MPVLSGFSVGGRYQLRKLAKWWVQLAAVLPTNEWAIMGPPVSFKSSWVHTSGSSTGMAAPERALVMGGKDALLAHGDFPVS